MQKDVPLTGDNVSVISYDLEHEVGSCTATNLDDGGVCVPNDTNPKSCWEYGKFGCDLEFKMELGASDTENTLEVTIGGTITATKERECCTHDHSESNKVTETYSDFTSVPGRYAVTFKLSLFMKYGHVCFKPCELGQCRENSMDVYHSHTVSQVTTTIPLTKDATVLWKKITRTGVVSGPTFLGIPIKVAKAMGGNLKELKRIQQHVFMTFIWGGSFLSKNIIPEIKTCKPLKIYSNYGSPWTEPP